MTGILNVLLGDNAGSTAYVGPLDLQSGARVWGGLRAGSLALVGSPVVRLIRSSDSTQQDISTITSGANKGHLNTADAFFNGSTYKVVTLYDQSGNGLDLTQGTDANRPALVLNVLGGTHPVIRFAAGGQFLTTAAMASSAQPNFVSAVVNNVSSSGTESYLGDGPSGNNAIGFNASNTAAVYDGATFTATATDNVWHAIQTVMAGASSDIYVDGTTNPAPGGGTQAMNTVVHMGEDLYGNSWVGDIVELGYWNGLAAPSSGFKSSMNSNQHTFWGF
jgi:hypothetical protein